MKYLQWKPLIEFKDALRELPYFAEELDLGVDIYEKAEDVVVEMHAPGVKPEKLDIEVNDNVLNVRGSREEEKEEKDKHFFRREIKRGAFEQSIVLPVNVQADGARASFEHGVLKVVLHKAKSLSAHKIKVETH